MTRQEKVIKALELLKQGQELLDEAGFMLVYDSYNDNGAYAVPKAVDFPDDCAVVTGKCKKSFEQLTDASVFLRDCPTAVDIIGLYNDGQRLVDNIPYWWKGWTKFIKPKKANVDGVDSVNEGIGQG